MHVRTPHGSFLVSYSTNVHAGESLDEVRRLLAEDVGLVKRRVAPDDPFGVELRLGQAAIAELSAGPALDDLAAWLAANDLFVFSLNGFPLRDFHAPVVKEEVYRPDWGEAERQQDTIRLAEILAALLPEGMEGSLSTSPGSYKPWGDHRARRAELARGFAPVLAALDRLRRERGIVIRLAVEPEPLCTCETVQEFADFVQAEALTHTVQALVDEEGLREADAVDAVHAHLGINLDAAHLAVEFEDPDAAVCALREARVPLAKLHVSAAARLRAPADNPEGLDALKRLDEPRYLHQTFARDYAGRIVFRAADLGEFLALPREAMADFAEVRVHFHMPLFAPVSDPLGSTADITEHLLQEVLASGERPHIVNETYTWPLLESDQDVHANIATELDWTLERLRQA